MKSANEAATGGKTKAALGSTSPASTSPRRRSMRWVVASLVVVLLLFGFAYNRHAIADLSKTNFGEVQLTRGLLLNKEPSAPFSGTLLLRDDDISLLGTTIFADTRLEPWTGADTQGLILEVSVEAGQLSGSATLYADLRESEMAQELGSGVGFLMAKWFAPRQKVATANFKESRLDGKASVWQPVGGGLSLRKLVEAEFKENQMHGTLRRYHESGALQTDMSFELGVPSGMQREHYKTGEVSREQEITTTGASLKAFYRNGQVRLHQVEEEGQTVSSQSWFPDGSQESVRSFSQGEQEDEKRWYSNGSLALDTAVSDQPLPPADGTVRQYHDNGSIHTEHQGRDGVMDGPFKIYYDNEQLWEQGNYAQGELDGLHQKWWKNGTKALESTWKNGQHEGKYERWYASGKVWESAQYKAGARVGRYLKQWKNGKIAHQYQYEQGKLEGLYKTFYDNGQPRLEATYKLGKLDGEYKNWLKDGSVYELATYEAGTKVQSSLNE